MRETRSSGSVRGASGDGRPYRERIADMAHAARKGPLTTPEPANACLPWISGSGSTTSAVGASGSSSKGSQTAAGLFSQPRDQFGGIGVSRQRR